ncbi:MAG: dihydrolipoyllysine-residue acetyltransferase [Melioribacteraceae bacterium]|nr:dihydrolipoyllysine-residue acetyltransferase [Melioribacteraceae bacterium]
MTVDFILPHLGDGIQTADVIKVMVKEGEKVEIDQIVIEIETDKATVEVPSEVSGLVTKLYVKEGTKAKVGEPVFTVEASANPTVKVAETKPTTPIKEIKAETKIESKPKEIQHASQTTSMYEFKVPELGENISSAQITKVLVSAGSAIIKDQILLEIETDKATVEIPSAVAGIVKEVKVKDGEKVAIGSTAFIIEATSSTSFEVKPTTQTPQPKEETAPASTEQSTYTKVIEHTHMPQAVIIPKDISKVVVPAAPSVRRFAREIGIDINQVRGTGKGNRISIEDVKSFAKNLNQQIQKGGMVGSGVSIAKETLPDFSKWGDIDRQPMSNIRRKTAEHLSYAWATVPHVTQFDKADITELEKLRKQFGKQVEAAGGKLTITAILLKVIASAMKEFPQFSSSVDMEKNEIIYKKYINIGIAVDTEKGLLVPVIRDVDKKNITQISVDLADVSKKARDKKLSIEDMQGGCFTISNLGGIGGTYFTPIVNTPEVAILGVSKSAIEPVYFDDDPALPSGGFKPRLMMPLSLSYDHRIIDGADAIRFLRWVINALENPFLLSL